MGETERRRASAPRVIDVSSLQTMGVGGGERSMGESASRLAAVDETETWTQRENGR